jgi:hypothetical protein
VGVAVRSVSLNWRQALFSQQSGEVALFLLTVTHPLLTTPIRLSTDPTQEITTDVYGTVSRGHNYLFVGMELALPDETDGAAPSTKLIISNVDRSIMPAVRSINSPAQVKMEGLLASDTETVEFTVPQLDINSVQYDAGQLTFELAMDAYATEEYPALSFNAVNFPGPRQAGQ